MYTLTKLSPPAPAPRRVVPLATPSKLPRGRTRLAGMLMAQAHHGWALQLSEPPSLKGVRLELLDLGTCCAGTQLAPGTKVRREIFGL